MPGQRQPTSLVMMKGKKNFTKDEIASRLDSEVKALTDQVKPPAYLSKDLKRKFKSLANQMIPLGILSNLDCDALARYLITEKQYREVTEALQNEPLLIVASDSFVDLDEDKDAPEIVTMEVNKRREQLMQMQERLFKLCRQGASDFGLTVSSRCRLVIPKEKEAPVNKFTKYAKSG